MLVLSRRVGESIQIPVAEGMITIRIVAFNGNQVRVGVEAPQSVQILRDDMVHKKPRAEQEAAR